VDTLAAHGALELAVGARDLEQQAAHRCGGVDVLLIEVEVDAGGLEVLNGSEQIDQRAAKPIDGLGHHDVEPPAPRILQHGV
jgi:hypothetical protein